MPAVRSETTAFTRCGVLFVEPPARWRAWQRDIWQCAELPMSPGRRAYEADCVVRPYYDGGRPRCSWAQLSPEARASWERNPTPRWPAKVAL